MRELLLAISLFICFALDMAAEQFGGFNATSESELFRQVQESKTGYDYLTTNVKDAQSVTTCAASCLQTDHCTGFVFNQNLTLCELVSEYCGGSLYRPSEGQLYTSKGLCLDKGSYQYVDIGIECEFCLKVSNISVPGITFEEARNICRSDGGKLLHFEDLRSPDFQNLLQLAEATEFADSFWIGINSLNVPDQLAWDHSDVPLTQTELNVLELYEPITPEAPVCIYMSSFFQEYYASNCSSPRGYICLIDT
ncbi:hypothetical protein Bpfe_008671 [Biomphalaria pfeifferi]|uniref:C-type lectin domain-containing protein n=1 Tax=Biomphalaria pfeifferi TaxID=112525 RepID=A0AAD8BW46_BIOPF|nr:hypothetical protein Bpfe_008671 [Biomphalaria pfeifferi]